MEAVGHLVHRRVWLTRTSQWIAGCGARPPGRSLSPLHLMFAWAGLMGIVTPVLRAQNARVVLRESNRPFGPDVGRVGDALLSDQVQFEVALKMRNLAELRRRIAGGEIISAAEMADRYYPLEADYRAVLEWLSGAGVGIRQIYENHLTVVCSGASDVVEKALDVRFSRIFLEGSQYIASDDPPSVPGALAPVILGVNGLQPQLLHSLIRRRSLTSPGFPPYSVSDILNAYNATGLSDSLGAIDGRTQTIAIVIDVYPLQSDLTQFWANNNISQSWSNLTPIYVTYTGPPSNSSVDLDEVTLDTSWSSGVAAASRIRVYVTGNLELQNINNGLQRLLSDLSTNSTIRQLSMSFGGCEDPFVSVLQTTSGLLAAIAAQGVTIFVSSGDSGSNPVIGGSACSPAMQVEYPASDPSVTAVGGTSLPNGSPETAWSGSGGGASSVFARPTWQAGVNASGQSCGLAGTSCWRLLPDVALDADPNTGYYLIVNSQPEMVGGTSAAAPTWTGFMALINDGRARAGKGPVGFLNSRVYPLLSLPAYSQNFRDITSGSNGAYSAGPGYDEVTGVGVPIVNNLYATLFNVSPIAQPVITGFSPSSGGAGTAFTINGNNFINVSSVRLCGSSTNCNRGIVASQFTATAPTEIVAMVPTGASTGPYFIEVVADGGLAVSPSQFLVVPASHFSVAAPSSATAGVPLQFTVAALDVNNNTVTNFADPVAFSSTDSSASMPGNMTLTNGVGTFSASLFAIGSQTITATDSLNSAINGTSAPISVTGCTNEGANWSPSATTISLATFCFQAGTSITANSGFVVNGTANVTFIAGGSITLGPGFDAKGTAGATFVAYVQ